MREQAWNWSRNPAVPLDISDFEAGFLISVLGGAHFGGDAKQAQVTLRMRVPEEERLKWMLARLPAGRLYGPYEYIYKDGGMRRFYQLMYRGAALKEQLLPFLDRHPWSDIAPEAFARCQAMRERYWL